MEVGSPRTDAQGTVGDGRERELSDVAGTLRRSDMTFLILGFRPF
jgi:hypothetical protein